MRIIVWNCHQRLDKKINMLMDLNPDVAIVPECATPEVPILACALEKYKVNKYAWNGSNDKKGLGVFIFNDAVKMDSIEKKGGKFSIKIDLNLNGEKINLIALWTQSPGYVEEAHKTIEAYKDILMQDNVILAGDFNSNKIWDSKRTLNHSVLVNRLKHEFTLESAYHHYFCEEQGKESRGTLYFTYNEHKPYHIDYIFIPQKWLSKIKTVELEQFKNWKHLSDHCPLILEVDF